MVEKYQKTTLDFLKDLLRPNVLSNNTKLTN